MIPLQQMAELRADKRDMIRRLTHDRRYCYCNSCERFNRSLAVRLIVSAPKVILAAFGLYIVGHVLVWIARGFPGWLWIGGM